MVRKDKLYYPAKEFAKKAWIKDDSIYAKAQKDPVAFWEKLAKDIRWEKEWAKAFEHKPPYIKWFIGGKLNITETIFEDLEKKKKKVALIFEPEAVEEPARVFTYKDLATEVNKLACSLKKLGIKKGDRVAIYLPMIPEAIISMLACARIGAAHAVVFSAFSSESLKHRLQSLEPKILISADGYYRRGQVIDLKSNADEGAKDTSVEKIIFVKRIGKEVPWNKEKDIWYNDLISEEKDFCQAEQMDSEDLLFVLPESGTSGQFLPVMHAVGGYTVWAKWTGKAILDLKDSDILWCTSDIGWITGHTYTVYAPLLNGSTLLIYEGAPDWPSPDRWAQIIDKHKVTIFYTAPTALRMFGGQDESVTQKRDFKSLRLLGSVGEVIDESTWLWYFEKIGKKRCPIVDTWWQTETGGIIISSLPGVGPFKPAYTGLPLPGINIDILDEEGKSCPANVEGNLVILPPFPPALLRGIYKNEKNYIENYWTRFGKEIYFTSDGAKRDENGLVRIVGRVDDTLKVAGHRIATSELENAAVGHPDIIEAATVGVPDEIKGEVPVVFAVSKSKRPEDELKKEIVGQIRKEIGPIALPKEIYIVEELPKTRSGKIMRGLLKKIFTGEEFGDVSALSNPEAVKKIKVKIEKKTDQKS